MTEAALATVYCREMASRGLTTKRRTVPWTRALVMKLRCPMMRRMRPVFMRTLRWLPGSRWPETERG